MSAADNISFAGSTERLFGTYHVPLGAKKARGVIICPPLFHEYYKAHNALRRIAIGLSEQGYDVLRFDYSGVGDSFGDSASMNDWIADIGVARRELEQLSGAADVRFIGVRFSAALILATGLPDLRAIFWDPCLNGSAYLAVLDEAQAELMRVHGNLRDAEKALICRTELLGYAVSPGLLSEFRGFNVPRVEADLSIVLSAREGNVDGDVVAKGGVERVDTICEWNTPNLQVFYANDIVQAVLSKF